MKRALHKLSARKVETVKKPGYYNDGGGLYLQVSKTVSKSWIFMFTQNKKTTEVGLGSYVDVSLELARDKAAEQRKLLKAGLNPLQEKRRIARERELRDAKAMLLPIVLAPISKLIVVDGPIQNTRSSGITR